MKRNLFLLICLACISGCRSTQYEATQIVNGATNHITLTMRTWISKTSVGTWVIDTQRGTSTLSNYNNDQVAGVQAIAQGVAQGIIAGSATAVKP